MNNLKVGDPVEVLDPGLLMMQALMKKMGEDVGHMNMIESLYLLILMQKFKKFAKKSIRYLRF